MVIKSSAITVIDEIIYGARTNAEERLDFTDEREGRGGVLGRRKVKPPIIFIGERRFGRGGGL